MYTSVYTHTNLFSTSCVNDAALYYKNRENKQNNMNKAYSDYGLVREYGFQVEYKESIKLSLERMVNNVNNYGAGYAHLPEEHSNYK
jgi:hypothetical protein